MMEARYRTACASCSEQMAPGTLISQNEAGEWVHANGCLDVSGLFHQSAHRPPGEYVGAKIAVCPHCFLQHGGECG